MSERQTRMQEDHRNGYHEPLRPNDCLLCYPPAAVGDIVERLRGGPDAAEVLEAAAEIERLRARLDDAEHIITMAAYSGYRMRAEAEAWLAVDDGPRHPGDEIDPTERVGWPTVGERHGVPAQGLPAGLPDSGRPRQPWEYFDGD